MRKLKLLLALCMATIAASASKTVYLAPGTWNVGGERYALCLLSDPQVWVNFTDADGDGVFTATFDDSSCTQMVICRMNGSSTENRWNNDGETGDDRPMWNQTQNIDISAIDGLTYTINNWDGDNGMSGYSTSGDTYLYNVGANAYLQNGANWNTHAALKSSGAKVTVTAGNGVYTIHNDGDRSGFFNGNGYVDSSTDNWTFEPVSGVNAFKLKSSAGNYAYASSGMYNVDLGADPGTNKAYWWLVTDTRRNDVSFATNLTPVELTHKINNPRFDDNNSGWQDAPTRGGNLPAGGDNTATNDIANPCVEHFNKTYDTYQTLTGLANGTYAVSVQGFYREGGYDAAAEKHVANTETLNAVLYANDETEPLMSIFEGAGKASGGKTATATGVNGAFPNDMVAASYWFSAGLYWNTVYVTVTDGTMKIGIKKSVGVGNDWTIFDNFRLQYFGNCSISEAKNGVLIVAYNEALEAAQKLSTATMEATAKSTLNGVIDANDDLDTTTATADELTAATTALNEAVAAAQPSADLYTTIRSLLDGLKTQYADFDRDAKYNAGEYTAISEVYSEYYAFATNKLGNAANTDFTKAIINPSFEFGNTLGWTYTPTNNNEHGAKTYAMSGKDGNYIFNIWSTGYPITQTISGLPKGLYELKALVANSGDDNGPAKVYLLANDEHKGITCDTNGEVGVEGSMKFAVGDDGTLTIGAVGSNNDADRSYSAAGVWWYKVDNFRLYYFGDVVSDEDAAALLATVPTEKMNSDVQNALDAAVSAFEASKTTDNYSALQTAIENANTSVTAYAAAKSAIDEAKDIQANTNVVTAAAATTFAEAIAAIETPYNNGMLSTDEANNAGTVLGVSASGWHGNPNGAAGKYMESAWDNADNFGDYYINTWSTEGNSDGSNFKVPFFEYWTSAASLGAKTMTATQEGLTPNGIYTVSVWARVTGNDKVANSITLQVGEGATTDLTAGTQIGSTGRYLDTFAATGQADDNGTLTIKINVAANSKISWLSFKNVKYTEVESASSGDYADLAAAITAAEANTLGFEAGEYAPYNNIEAMKALAAAKAIDANAVNAKEDVTAATTALTAATWTANTGEVNAIYDGSFNLTTATSGSYIVPTGWTNLGYNTRVYNASNMGDNAGVNATSQTACMFAKFTTEYGTEAGYTMPLKAGEYELNFIYGGWNEIGTRDIKIYSGELQATVTPVTVTAKNNTAHTNVDSWASYKGSVIIPADGDYVLSFYRQSTTSQNQIAISDIVLKKAPVYAVVGGASFFSGPWDEGTTTDRLTLENGVYTKTYANQELEAQTIEFKVIKKASVDADAADTWYGNSEGNNVEMVIAEAGTYDITINFDGSNISYILTPLTETFNVTAAGWATAITHNAVDFTGVEGLKAYTATVAEGVVTLAEAGAVPAGTALVLKGATKAVPIVESAAAVENDLKGSNEYDYVISDEMDAQYNFYGLTVSGETAKFAKLNKGTIQPGKAYLQIEKPATGGARELKVVFAGDATGIDAVVAEKAVEGIYNMNGQRVVAPAKGLYIVNGKKVVLK